MRLRPFSLAAYILCSLAGILSVTKYRRGSPIFDKRDRLFGNSGKSLGATMVDGGLDLVQSDASLALQPLELCGSHSRDGLEL